METIFLIGGSGFIGKNLVLHLKSKYRIVVFDKFIDEKFFDQTPEIDKYKLDLVNEQIPEHLESPEFIINLASIVTAERDLSLFDGLISSNFKILLNLYNRFKTCSKLKILMQFGSSEEYGSENSPFVETMRENPHSPYGLIKQLTTNTALMLNQNYNFPIMVVRPGNLFGTFQSKDKFIPYIIGQLKHNLPLNVSPCEQKRDFIFVSDFSWALDCLIDNYKKCIGEIVNISSGKSISLKSIIEICKTELNSTSIVNYGALPYREKEIMDLKCSVDKLSEIIGQPIHFDIETRLKEYVFSVH